MPDEESNKYLWARRVTVQNNRNFSIYAVLTFSLLAYAVFVTLLLYRENRQAVPIQKSTPPYLITEVENLFDYITQTTGYCSNSLVIDGSSRRDGENATLSGHEGTFICLDGMPNTPDKCRIYSFGFNRDDIRFESKMGKRGCRVHMVSALTEYSYSQMGSNIYLYPLELSNSTGLGKYTLDSFINLMNHMDKPIHYIKTTLQGTEWTLLTNIFSSAYDAQFHVKQVRLMIHLPYADDEHVESLFETYRLLLGFEYYGYKLIYSKPITDNLYFHYNFDRQLSTKYETVWMKQ